MELTCHSVAFLFGCPHRARLLLPFETCRGLRELAYQRPSTREDVASRKWQPDKDDAGLDDVGNALTASTAPVVNAANP